MMGTAGKKIAVLVDDHFEESELVMPIKILKENKMDMTVISAKDKKLQAMNGAVQAKAIKADLSLDTASSKDYDALLLPGGIYNATNLRINEKAQAWAIDFMDSGRPIAASGYSSLLLVSADLIEERRLTSPPEIQDDIKNAAGEWVNRPIVVDKNLITSRGYGDSGNLCDNILKQLS